MREPVIATGGLQRLIAIVITFLIAYWMFYAITHSISLK